MYQISANLVHRELRNATFEEKKIATSIKRPDSDHVLWNFSKPMKEGGKNTIVSPAKFYVAIWRRRKLRTHWSPSSNIFQMRAGFLCGKFITISLGILTHIKAQGSAPLYLIFRGSWSYSPEIPVARFSRVSRRQLLAWRNGGLLNSAAVVLAYLTAALHGVSVKFE